MTTSLMMTVTWVVHDINAKDDISTDDDDYCNNDDYINNDAIDKTDDENNRCS